MPQRQLYYGDNLPYLRQLPDESIDCFYGDPPFNSNQDYIDTRRTPDGGIVRSKAFTDIPEEEHQLWTDIIYSPRTRACLQFLLQRFTKQDDPVLLYLLMMAPRLVEIHRLLKSTGNFFLHCDDASNYHLRELCDFIFLPKGKFRNVITWVRRQTSKSPVKHSLPRNTDSIIFYSKRCHNYFQPEYLEYTEEYLKKNFRYIEEETGRHYALDNLTSVRNQVYEFLGFERPWAHTKEHMQELYDTGKIVQKTPRHVPRRKIYRDESKGVMTSSIWSDLPLDKKNCKYPTQKPKALLSRILNIGCPPDGTVLDCWCGSGTTLAAADEKNLSCIGMDLTYQAIASTQQRLEKPLEIFGVPDTLEAAKKLSVKDWRTPHEFAKWAILTYTNNEAYLKETTENLIGLYWYRMCKILMYTVVHISADILTELIQLKLHHNAEVAVLITLEEPSQALREELLKIRVEPVTIAELLSGKQVPVQHT